MEVKAYLRGNLRAMKIHNPRTGEVVENVSCHGCLCHELPIQFGKEKDICVECGCPKTEVGFDEFKRNLQSIAKVC